MSLATYTVEVRRICQAIAEQNKIQTFDDVERMIKIAYPSIFSDYIPFFDESYKAVLCTKILRHYYTREIGLETVGLWKLKLNTKMAEIMPYYNQLYQSELLKFDPLKNTQYSVKSKRTFDGKNVLDGIQKTDTNSNTDFIGNRKTENTDTETTKTDRNQDTTVNFNQDEKEKFGKNTTHVYGGKTQHEFNEEDTQNYGKKETQAHNTTDETTINTTINYDGKETTKNIVPEEFESLTKYSDTPQGSIENIKAGKYLTNVTAVVTPKSESDSIKTFENRTDKNSGSTALTKTGNDTTTFSGSDVLLKSGTTTDTKTGEDTDKESGENSKNLMSNNIENKHETSDSNIKNILNGNEKIKNTTILTNDVLGKTDNTTKINNIDDYIESVFGKQGSETYSEMLIKFRDTFLNIDMLVIDNLETLFMGLW